MKVSFSELSDFLADPEEWAKTKLSASSHPRMSYAHVTRMAAYRFHQKKSKSAGLAALARYLDSYSLVNVEKRAAAEAQLTSYMAWADKSHPLVLSVETRIRLELGSGIYTSGHVHRADLDLVSGGYKAILLGTPITSSKDPRATVLKLGYSELTKRDPRLVHAAWQNLDGSGLTIVNVQQKTLRDTHQSLCNAASAANAVFARVRP